MSVFADWLTKSKKVHHAEDKNEVNTVHNVDDGSFVVV